MLANLLALLPALGLLAPAAAVDLSDKGVNPANYITVAAKDRGLRLFNGPHYYIPGGSCDGLLNTSYLCGSESIEGIEVKVTDPSRFALVDIDLAGSEVRIMRFPPVYSMDCPKPALVDLRLSCNRWKLSRSRNRVRLPDYNDDSDSDDSHSYDDDDDDNDDDDVTDDAQLTVTPEPH